MPNEKSLRAVKKTVKKLRKIFPPNSGKPCEALVELYIDGKKRFLKR